METKTNLDYLNIGWIPKNNLRKMGIDSVEELEKFLSDNKTVDGIKDKTLSMLKTAVSDFRKRKSIIVVVDKNKLKAKGDNKMGMEIKTKSVQKPTVNRYDIANMLLEIVVEKCNDKDEPKYRLEKYPEFPSYHMFYDDKLVYLQFDWCNELLEEKLKDYTVISTANSAVAQKPIFMATTFLTNNSPLHCNTKNGKQYCFSSYKYILPVDYKYVRFNINKLEDRMNVKIDLTMNDDLTEEWLEERMKMVDEMNNAVAAQDSETPVVEEIMEHWEPTMRGLCETWITMKDYDNAAKTCIDYSRTYIMTNKSYTGIEYDVIAKLIDFKSKIKDVKLRSTVEMLISDIQSDMNSEEKVTDPVVDNTLKTLESVLEKDLSKLPEDIRNEITSEILADNKEEEKEEKEEYVLEEIKDDDVPITAVNNISNDILVNSCQTLFGDTVVLVFTIVVQKSYTGVYDFKNEVYTGTYQFRTSQPEVGMISIDPAAGESETIKTKLLGIIKSFG